MVIRPIFEATMESDVFDHPTLRIKDLYQAASSADSVRGNARTKAVRASYEFWSTSNEARLEQAFTEIIAEEFPRRETTGLVPSKAGDPDWTNT